MKIIPPNENPTNGKPKWEYLSPKGNFVKTYRKKPIAVRAIQWIRHDLTYNRIDELVNKPDRIRVYPFAEIPNALILDTSSGDGRASFSVVGNGDYIVEDVEGNFYPCKREVFEATYDEIEE